MFSSLCVSVCVWVCVWVCVGVCYPERVWIFIISHSVFINAVITTSSVDYLCTRMGRLGLSGKMFSFFFFFIQTGSQMSKQQQEAAFLVTVSLSWMVCVSVCLSTCNPFTFFCSCGLCRPSNSECEWHKKLRFAKKTHSTLIRCDVFQSKSSVTLSSAALHNVRIWCAGVRLFSNITSHRKRSLIAVKLLL